MVWDDVIWAWRPETPVTKNDPDAPPPYKKIADSVPSGVTITVTEVEEMIKEPEKKDLNSWITDWLAHRLTPKKKYVGRRALDLGA